MPVTTTTFAFVLEAMETAAAAANFAARSRKTYEAFKAAAERNVELTPEQSAQLDARAEGIFSEAAQNMSGR